MNRIASVRAFRTSAGHHSWSVISNRWRRRIGGVPPASAGTLSNQPNAEPWSYRGAPAPSASTVAPLIRPSSARVAGPRRHNQLWPVWTRKVALEMIEQAGVGLYFHTWVTGVLTAGDGITGVTPDGSGDGATHLEGEVDVGRVVGYRN